MAEAKTDKKQHPSEVALADFQSKNADVLFVIARSKNLNLVVYEAQRSADKKSLNPAKPIDVYWMDVDPAYQADKRKKGVQSDREDLNAFEKKFAYGLSFEPIAGNAGQYKIVLVALAARPLTLSLDSEGRAHAALTINNAPAYLHRIFVFSVERTLLPPRVDYVELFGVHTGTGEAVYEKIKV